jgi:hypothetical protein
MPFDPREAFVTCPRRCDVATLPEPVQNRPGHYACTACGHEFTFRADPPMVSR